MAIVPKHLDGFDHYVTGEGTDIYEVFNGTATISTSSPRTGTGHLRGNASGNSFMVGKAVDAETTYVVAVAVRVNAYGGSGTKLIGFNLSDASDVQASLKMTSAGKLEFYRGDLTTQLGSTGAHILGLGWNHIEMVMTCDNSAGAFKVRLNGVEELSGTSLDTQAQSSSDIGFITLGAANISANQVDFDDLHIGSCDTTADTFGDAIVATVYPSGAGSNADFTPSTGSNYQNVDDAASDGDSTYNSTAGVGDIDTFAFTDLSNAASVHAVQVVTTWKKDSGGSRTARVKAIVDSNPYNGDTISLTNSYTKAKQVFAVNPDTTDPWTLTEINDAEFGYELVA